MDWLKQIITRYMQELNTDAPVDADDIEYRADRMMEEIQRTLNARKDFKEDK